MKCIVIRGRITIARSNIVDDRSLVAIRPREPDELHTVSCIRTDICLACSSTLVAVDISSSKCCGLNIANILVKGVPSCSYRARPSLVVIPIGVRAISELGVYVHAFDEAMSGYGAEKDGCRYYREEKRRGYHFRDKLELKGK
jgi:hypothetical protein